MNRSFRRLRFSKWLNDMQQRGNSKQLDLEASDKPTSTTSPNFRYNDLVAKGEHELLPMNPNISEEKSYQFSQNGKATEVTDSQGDTDSRAYTNWVTPVDNNEKTVVILHSINDTHF